MYFQKNRSCAFSGYRPEKFPFSLIDSNDELAFLRLDISHAIIEAIRQEYSVFLCGMAKGFDLLCAEILLDIRKQSPEFGHVRLVGAIPFESHGFAGEWGEKHRQVYNQLDEEIILAAEYSDTSYYKRNKYMIENASRLICYWDGLEGGTAQTVRMAQRMALEIVNLYNGQVDG